MHVHHEEIIVIWMLATQLLAQLCYCRQVLEIFILTELTGYKLLQSKPFKFVKAGGGCLCCLRHLQLLKHADFSAQSLKNARYVQKDFENSEPNRGSGNYKNTIIMSLYISYKSPCRTVNLCYLHLFNHPLLNVAFSHALDFLFWQKVVQMQ